MTERAKPLGGTVPDNAFDVAVEHLSREQRRSRRQRDVRARTISVKRMTKRDLYAGAAEFPDVGHWRPVTRGDCADVERPCPYVSCRFHLFLDVSPVTGAIKLNFPDLEPDELEETCCLDVADRGGETLEEAGAFMNMTRERLRQIETRAFRRVLSLQHQALSDHVGDDKRTVVRVIPEEP